MQTTLTRAWTSERVGGGRIAAFVGFVCIPSLMCSFRIVPCSPQTLTRSLDPFKSNGTLTQFMHTLRQRGPWCRTSEWTQWEALAGGVFRSESQQQGSLKGGCCFERLLLRVEFNKQGDDSYTRPAAGPKRPTGRHRSYAAMRPRRLQAGSCSLARPFIEQALGVSEPRSSLHVSSTLSVSRRWL